MMSIVVVFWMYVFLFAFIGGMRGWAKELLVTFSAILALAISTRSQTSAISRGRRSSSRRTAATTSSGLRTGSST